MPPREHHRLVGTYHSTCTISDYDATVASLARLVGLRVLEYSESELIGRRGGMTWIGDGSLEVSQPIVEGHASQRFLAEFGPGMHSYALQVRDLDATIDHLAAHGVGVGVRPADFFCFTRPSTTGGLLFEWSESTVGEDPRIGAPVPPFTVEPLLDVRSHSFVGALVPDPLEWADHFGPIFGLEERFRDPSGGATDPIVALAAPDCTIALYRHPRSDCAELWGAHHERPRFHVLGLEVADLDEAARVLDEAGIRLLGRTEAMLLPVPAATGDVPLALVDRPLQGRY
jgi:catechol 2,3-dioxygenase-like lactoylglutathione lyase family enzyme